MQLHIERISGFSKGLTANVLGRKEENVCGRWSAAHLNANAETCCNISVVQLRTKYIIHTSTRLNHYIFLLFNNQV